MVGTFSVVLKVRPFLMAPDAVAGVKSAPSVAVPLSVVTL